MTDDELDAAIMAAHAKDDTRTLAELYAQAGERVLGRGSIDHGCFLMTQAFIFALDAGWDRADALRDVLISHGREIPFK